jgi:hypothetical protein
VLGRDFGRDVAPADDSGGGAERVADDGPEGDDPYALWWRNVSCEDVEWEVR